MLCQALPYGLGGMIQFPPLEQSLQGVALY